MEETEKTIFYSNNDKALSLDGFLTGFFKNHEGVAGKDVTVVILDFFHDRMIKQINRSHLILIPKYNRAIISRISN